MRYSARDMAIFLAQHRRVPVVLGSATPALESFHNAKAGRFGHLRLRLRPAAVKPQIRLVEQQENPPPHGLSENVLLAISARRARGEQSLSRTLGTLPAVQRCSAESLSSPALLRCA